MGTGFDLEKQGKNVSKVDLMKKSTNKYNQKFKQFEPDLDKFAEKVIKINHLN